MNQIKISGNNFLAIDFETANRDRNSACAIGLVRVANNMITHFESYLIKPPTNYFEFTYLHGISSNDVKDSPTFKELWPTISHHFRGIDFVVAHNATFDQSVLERSCSHYGIALPSITYNCTMKLSRRHWNIRPTKLSDVCRHFGIPLDHHQAASDTLACAKIMLLALNDENKSFRVNSVYVPTLKINKQKVSASYSSSPVFKPIETNNAVQISKPQNNYIYRQVDNNAFKIPLTQETNINQDKHENNYDNLKVLIRIIFGIVFIYVLSQLLTCQNRKNVKDESSIFDLNLKSKTIYTAYSTFNQIPELNIAFNENLMTKNCISSKVSSE